MAAMVAIVIALYIQVSVSGISETYTQISLLLQYISQNLLYLGITLILTVIAIITIFFIKPIKKLIACKEKKIKEIDEYKQLDKEIEKLNGYIRDFKKPNGRLAKTESFGDYSEKLQCPILNNRLKELKKRYKDWYDWFAASKNCIGFAVAYSFYVERRGLESEYEKIDNKTLGIVLIGDLTKEILKELNDREPDELKGIITVDWYKNKFPVRYKKISQCDYDNDFPLILSEVRNKLESDSSIKNLVRAKREYFDSYKKLKREIDTIKWWQLWKFWKWYVHCGMYSENYKRLKGGGL